jgi:phosphoribosylformylglycinamidine synthase PurS subunit
LSAFRYAVSIMPRQGMLDPQGRAVEAAMPQLDAASVHDVRVGRRVELTVDAAAETEARELVERLAASFLANPLVESWQIELVGPVEVAA